MKTSIVLASLVFAAPAMAASGNAVLHGSSTDFGQNYPHCITFKTTADGVNSDDGFTYVVPDFAAGRIIASDLQGSGGGVPSLGKITFIALSPGSAAYNETVAVCPVGGVNGIPPGDNIPVGKIRWQ